MSKPYSIQISVIVVALLACLSCVTSAAASSSYADEFNAYMQAMQSRDLQKAEQHANNAVSIAEKTLSDNHPDLAQLLFNHGQVLAFMKNWPRAKEVLTRTVTLQENIHGKNSVQLIPTLTLLARSMIQHDRPIPLELNRAIKLARQHYGKNSERLAKVLLEMARGLYDTMNYTMARDRYREVHKIYNQILGPEHEQTIVVGFWLGETELARGKYKKARDLFIPMTLNESKYKLRAHAALAAIYEHLNDDEKASEHSLAISSAQPAEPNQDPILLHSEYPIWSTRAGFLIVEFDIDEKGFVRNPEIIRNTTGEYYKDEVMAAIKKWRYLPRYENGKAVATEDLQFQFRLSNPSPLTTRMNSGST